MLNVAMIGAGRIGQVHAAAVAKHPRANLVMIADPFDGRAKALAAPYGAEGTDRVDDVFADHRVHAVIIGSPTPLHVEHILKSVKAGKAVLCEKPVASDVVQARALDAELAAGPHPTVMLGFQRRFDPSLSRARTLIDEGAIGQVEQLVITSRDPAPPPASYIAASGGIFADMTIHDFDLVRFFLGEVTEVFAFGQNLLPELAGTGDFDAATVLLRAESGAVASITNHRRCASGYDQRVEIHGGTGSLAMDNHRATTLTLNTGAYTGARDPYLDFFLQRYAEAYTQELATFIEAVIHQRPVSPTVADGVAALELAEAAEVSARTGRAVQLARSNAELSRAPAGA